MAANSVNPFLRESLTPFDNLPASAHVSHRIDTSRRRADDPHREQRNGIVHLQFEDDPQQNAVDPENAHNTASQSGAISKHALTGHGSLSKRARRRKI